MMKDSIFPLDYSGTIFNNPCEECCEALPRFPSEIKDIGPLSYRKCHHGKALSCQLPLEKYGIYQLKRIASTMLTLREH